MLNQHEGNNVLIAFRAKVAGLITVGKNSFFSINAVIVSDTHKILSLPGHRFEFFIPLMRKR
jgi:serine acetyltransferase